MSDVADGVIKLDLEKFAQWVRDNYGENISPFENDPWGLDFPLSPREVRGLAAPVGQMLDLRQIHAQAIAAYVNAGWEHPIDIDVGIPSLGYLPSWPIEDGHHRLAAAIMLGRPWILAAYAGAVDVARELIYQGDSP